MLEHVDIFRTTVRRGLAPLCRAAQSIFDLVLLSLRHLKKADVDDDLYTSACHVIESLDSVRSCCILAELSNDALAEHEPNAEEQVCRLMNTLFDVMRCVAVARTLSICSCGARAALAQSSHSSFRRLSSRRAALGSPDTPKVVEEHINNVIIAVLEELSVITTDIVLCLLSRLVKKVRELVRCGDSREALLAGLSRRASSLLSKKSTLHIVLFSLPLCAGREPCRDGCLRRHLPPRELAALDARRADAAAAAPARRGRRGGCGARRRRQLQEEEAQRAQEPRD